MLNHVNHSDSSAPRLRGCPLRTCTEAVARLQRLGVALSVDPAELLEEGEAFGHGDDGVVEGGGDFGAGGRAGGEEVEEAAEAGVVAQRQLEGMEGRRGRGLRVDCGIAGGGEGVVEAAGEVVGGGYEAGEVQLLQQFQAVAEGGGLAVEVAGGCSRVGWLVGEKGEEGVEPPALVEADGEP